MQNENKNFAYWQRIAWAILCNKFHEKVLELEKNLEDEERHYSEIQQDQINTIQALKKQIQELKAEKKPNKKGPDKRRGLPISKPITEG